MEKVITKAQTVWNGLPKEVKVSTYMLGAALLDQAAKDLTPEMINFIPTAYRLMAFNLIEVLIVEMVKRLRATK